MRTSQKKLSSKEEKRIKLEFATLLTDIKNPNEMIEFLDSFLKENEFLGLSKRASVIRLLSKGCSYEMVQKTLNVSSATVSSIANFGNEKILAKIIQKFEVDDWAGRLAKKIIGFFPIRT
jgi:uncharacterized protein YerC